MNPVLPLLSNCIGGVGKPLSSGFLSRLTPTGCAGADHSTCLGVRGSGVAGVGVLAAENGSGVAGSMRGAVPVGGKGGLFQFRMRKTLEIFSVGFSSAIHESKLWLS